MAPGTGPLARNPTPTATIAHAEGARAQNAATDAARNGSEASDRPSATNRREVPSAHVAISAGRDYRDVRPLSGIYSGGVTSSMFVDVQITRLS